MKGPRALQQRSLEFLLSASSDHFCGPCILWCLMWGPAQGRLVLVKSLTQFTQGSLLVTMTWLPLPGPHCTKHMMPSQTKPHSHSPPLTWTLASCLLCTCCSLCPEHLFPSWPKAFLLISHVRKPPIDNPST